MLSMVRQYFHEACYLVILNQSTLSSRRRW